MLALARSLDRGGDAGERPGVVDRLAPAFHHPYQFVKVDGFAEEVVHAFGHAIITILAGSVGGHCDDHRLLASAGPDLAGGLEAVHFGHLDIHEDKIERFFLQLVEDFFPIFGDAGRIAHFVEDEYGQLTVDRVVFRQEDPEGVFFGQAGESVGSDFDGREAGEDGKSEERAFAR